MADLKPDDKAQIGAGRDLGDDDKAKLGQGKDIQAGGDDVGQRQIDPAKLQEFMTKHNLSSVDDVVNFVADKDRKITELSTKSKLANYQTQLPPMPQVRREPTKVNIELPDNVENLLDDREKLKGVLNQIGEKAKSAALSDFRAEQDEQRMMTMYNEANRLIALDPEKWHRLKGTMKGLLEQYPNARLMDIYEEADRLFTDNKKQAIAEIKKELGLEGFNPADIRTILGKTNTAPIHDTGGATGAGVGLVTKRPDQMTRQEREELIKESIFGDTASVLRDDET